MPSNERGDPSVFEFKQQENKSMWQFSKQNSLIRFRVEIRRISSWILKADS